jgi:hypothetical protein
VLRVGGDARRRAHLLAEIDLRLRHALDDGAGDRQAFVLVPAGEEDRELVASQAEGLTPLAQAGRHLRQDLVPGRMSAAVVDLLEVVDVEEAERERKALLLRPVEIVLEPLLEVGGLPSPVSGSVSARRIALSAPCTER